MDVVAPEMSDQGPEALDPSYHCRLKLDEPPETEAERVASPPTQTSVLFAETLRLTSGFTMIVITSEIGCAHPDSVSVT